MTKANIPQYSATAASNTDVQDIDIAENCAPSGINNAIREIMADLKDQDTGAVAMTSPVLTTADINGGTADNVTIGGSTPAAGTFTTVTTSGEITANGGIALGDNDKATFGDGDLEIYHDGSNSYISDQGVGSLWVQATNLIVEATDGSNYLTAVDGGAVKLYYADGASNEKLATTSTGIAVTGNIDSSDISNFSATYNDFSGDGLHIQSTGTSGNGAYAGGISFSRISSDNDSRAAGIAAVQTDTDVDRVGLAFFTHPSGTTSNDLSEAMRIDASGHAIIPAGVTLGTAAGVYSADNTLDDYEEGSYTVEMYDASSGGNASSTTTTGYYTKIGNQVTVRFDALNNISTTGMTGANDAYLTLPFAAGSTGRSVGSIIMDNLAFTVNRSVVAPVVVDNASRAGLFTTGVGVSDVNTEVQDFNDNATDIHTFTLTYFTS